MSVNEIVDSFVKIAVDLGADIAPIENAFWIDELETKLGKRYPPSFHSLLTRYQFAPFEIGGIEFFANTGSDDIDEMSVAIFRDPIISQTTQAQGFVQFARPADGSYDPICFDTSAQAHNREYPIVQIDHEQILSFDRVGTPGVKAASFYQFVLGVIKNSA